MINIVFDDSVKGLLKITKPDINKNGEIVSLHLDMDRGPLCHGPLSDYHVKQIESWFVDDPLGMMNYNTCYKHI